MSRSGKSTIEQLLDEHIIGIATVIYTAFAIPAYFIFEGRVGFVGTVDPSVTIIALALGSILFVPGITVWLRSKRVDWGFAKGTDR